MLSKIIVVGLAATLGAVLRYAIVELISNRLGWKDFPVATILINVTGAFALGYFTGHLAATSLAFLVGSGVTGGYTTFSTYINETLHLQFKNGFKAGAYFIGTTLLGVFAAYLGMII
ncbi:fluoride efflux transporter FluC [Lactobacillaceae bacterium Scapto_B20]